jgi:serine protease Do
MRRFPSLVTVGWLLFVASIAWADSTAEIVARVKSSVVTIITLDQSHKPICSGTGFCIMDTGDSQAFVTNKHVVAGTDKAAGRYYVAVADEGEKSLETSDVLPFRKYDLAIVFFSGAQQLRTLFLPLLTNADSDSLVQGQRVIVIGSPLGLDFSGTVSEGIISAFRDHRKIIQITAPISHGSSGSPVFDENGEVIGVAFAGIEGGQNLNFAIPIKYLLDFNSR